MANFEKFTSGFKIGDTDVGILAAKISTDTSGVVSAWPSNTAMSAVSSFVPTIGAVESEIKSKISTVYKVMGTTTAQVDSTSAITGFDPAVSAENGNVYNVALPRDSEGKLIVTNATLNGQEITDGDNIVYVSADRKWDKLAGSIDVTKYATKSWVNDGSKEGSLPMQMISGAYTTSAQMTALSANVSALVMNAGIQNYVGGYISENTLKTAEELSGIDSATSGKLVNAGAISGYIKDQIDSTIQETIDIAEVLTSGMSGTDIKPASAVPNAGAVTGYIDTNTIKTSAAMIAGTDNSAGLVSNDAIKSYVSAQLAGTNAYGRIIVNDASASASQPNDVFKVKSGSGVTVATANDGGHPTIVFNHNISISGTAGTATGAAEFTVSATTSSDGKVNFAITVPDATTGSAGKAGVVKADYYEESSGLIYLF